MDIWTIVVGIGVVVGIVAGVIQILDSLQQRQEGKAAAQSRSKRRGFDWSFAFQRRKHNAALSDYLRKEQERIFSESAPGSMTLQVGDVIRNDEMFISPPWASYGGSAQAEDLMAHLMEAISQAKQVLLLGEAGQGKTTILKRVFSIAAERFLNGASDIFPLYIPLRDVMYPNGDGTLSGLWRYLSNRSPNFFPLPLEAFTSLVHDQRVALLFDGFDEVKGELSNRAINERTASEILHLRPTILTCRTSFYELYLSTSSMKELFADKIELRPLEFLTDSVRQHIAAFCSIKGKAAPDRIVRAIAANQALLDLAKRPLLLVMALDIFIDSPDLIEREWSLAKLYKAYTEKWLRNEAAKPDSVLKWHEKAILVEEIAWSAYRSKAPTAYAYGVFYQSVTFTGTELQGFLQPYAARYTHIPFVQLIDDIRLRTFLIGGHWDEYYFIHRSFQEYYVANRMFDSMQRNPEDALQTLCEFIPVEVATFLKDMLRAEVLPRHSEKVIAHNLVEVYRRSSDPDVCEVEANANGFRSRLRQNLVDYFSEEELRTLCFDLGLNYEDLPGQSREGKARELVVHLQRIGRIQALVERCRQLRPNVEWQDRPGSEGRRAERPRDGRDMRSVMIREHVCYCLACLGTQEAVQFLEQVYEQEPDKWVQRGIMVGLFLQCGRTEMVDRYIDILHTDPEAASINIGYHLVYYGDQPMEEGYYDRGGKRCEGSVRAIFRHLKSERSMAGWVLDLLTLRTLLETRGAAILSNEADRSFLVEFLAREQAGQGKSFADEKRLLEAELRRQKLL